MNQETFAQLFELNDYCVRVNTEGITDTESLIKPNNGGNCCNWVLGHIVSTRNSILELLGEQPIWSEQETENYKRGSKPINGESESLLFETILAAFDRSQEQILSALKHKTDEALAQKIDDETVGQKLATLHFHEAYHIGQLGLLRRIAGKEGAIK